MVDQLSSLRGLPLVLERLTPCAARVLNYAQEEARVMGHAHVGTEHLLIGLSREEHGAASTVLAGLGHDAGSLRAKTDFIVGTDENPDDFDSEVEFTPRIVHIFETAESERLKRQLSEIGTLLLLYALVREREGVAVMLLETPGVGLERIGGAMLRALRDGAKDEPIDG
jgi:ATP-dependent Clp protease ATP-binding subunit ClpA